MSALLTVTFSTLQGAAIVIAAVNAVAFAAALVCLFFLHWAEKEKTDKKGPPRNRPSKP